MVEVIQTIGGYEVETRDNSLMDAALLAELLGEDDHYGIFGRTFKTGIDIGANIGGFALLACRDNAGLDLECYEPEPSNYDVLSGNIARNDLVSRVHAHRQAVWAETASLTLSVLEGCSHVCDPAICKRMGCLGLTTQVDAVSLDSIRSGEQVDLLKVDCEGGEFELLPAADLSRFGYLCMEFHDFHGAERRLSLWDYLNATHAMSVRYWVEGNGGIWTGELR